MGLDMAPTGDPYSFFRVDKMTFAKSQPRRQACRRQVDSEVQFANYACRDPRLGVARTCWVPDSAVDWMIDRYQVKPDKAAGITNDPNDWSREVGNPRYILDLLARIVALSVETMKIVGSLPVLEIVRPSQS